MHKVGSTNVQLTSSCKLQYNDSTDDHWTLSVYQIQYFLIIPIKRCKILNILRTHDIATIYNITESLFPVPKKRLQGENILL